ncbi:hypothetical protein HHI36_009721 [Cryptolaemus montrouzieri]|uniref:Uncharacterized protein n=1 Tax=Cryptolaemus montrouzieri TaxID=559131 RepID=A0ABD2MGP7_9CUCU
MNIVNFKLHSLVKFNNLICVQCWDICQAACLMKTKNWTRVDGYKIICSRKCNKSSSLGKNISGDLGYTEQADEKDGDRGEAHNTEGRDAHSRDSCNTDEIDTDMWPISPMNGQDTQRDVNLDMPYTCQLSGKEAILEKKLEELNKRNDELSLSEEHE